MKDLFVYVADADILRTIEAILVRHQALGIRELNFDVDRIGQKDPSIFKEGPDFVKNRKNEFSKCILMCDFWGLNLPNRKYPDIKNPIQAEDFIQQQLNVLTWSNNSCAIVFDNVLEDLFWHHKASVATVCGIDEATLEKFINEFDQKHNELSLEHPQKKSEELFYYVVDKSSKTKPPPLTYKKIAGKADLSLWCQARSFKKLVQTLRNWFPLENPLTPPIDC